MKYIIQKIKIKYYKVGNKKINHEFNTPVISGLNQRTGWRRRRSLGHCLLNLWFGE